MPDSATSSDIPDQLSESPLERLCVLTPEELKAMRSAFPVLRPPKLTPFDGQISAQLSMLLSLQLLPNFGKLQKNLEKGNQSSSSDDELSKLKEMVNELYDGHRNRTRYREPRVYQTAMLQNTRTLDNRPVCYYCNKTGHVQINCRKKQYDERMNQPNRQNYNPPRNYPRPNYNGQSYHRSDNTYGQRYHRSDNTYGPPYHRSDSYAVQPYHRSDNHSNQTYPRSDNPYHSAPNRPNPVYSRTYLNQMPNSRLNPETNLPSNTQPKHTFNPQPTQPQHQPQILSDQATNPQVHCLSPDKNYIITTAWVNDQKVECFIDTGSAFSIIRISVLKNPQTIQRYEGPMIKSATGHFLEILGKTRCLIKVTGVAQSIWTNLIVASDNFSYPLLLGNNYNRMADIQLDWQNMTIRPQTNQMETDKSDSFSIDQSEFTQVNQFGFHYDNGEGLVPLDFSIIDGDENQRCLTLTFDSHKTVNIVSLNEQSNPPKLINRQCNQPFYYCNMMSPTIDYCIGSDSLERDMREREMRESEIYDTHWSDINENELISPLGSDINFIPSNDEKETKVPDLGVEASIETLELSHLENEQAIKIKNMLKKFLPTLAFNKDNLGHCTLFYHSIDTEGHAAIRSHPYPRSEIERKEINKQIEEMMKIGVIRPSASPWASPIVLVNKPDGSKRLCVDLRKVNAITKKDVYPLPNIDIILSSLRGCSYFTAIDLNSGYWQISVNPDDCKKTAFVTQDGLYEFVRMPFGLTNAPATFQRTMDVVLAGLKYNQCLVYLDDVVIFAQSFDELLTRTENVLQALQNAGLTIKVSKCHWAVREMLFLGHVVNAQGIRTDPRKIEDVKNFPAPKDITGIRSFMGMAGYYRKFIPKFSEIAEPLTRLTRKIVSFNWTDEQDRAFNKIKELLLQDPVLVHFNPSDPIEVHCDASGIGVGAVLMHRIEKEEKPVWYLSRLLHHAELRYSTTEKECLAIVFALEKLRPFISGLHFTVYTDHRALCWLKTKAKLPDRLLKWAIQLEQYSFDIVYRTGKSNVVADYLSRNPVRPMGQFMEPLDKYSINLLTIDQSIARKQRSDPTFNKIICALESPEDFPNIECTQFVLKDMILYKLIEREIGPALALCVPKKLIEEIIASCHDDPIAGHLGFYKTINKIKSRYWWPDLQIDVKTYVETCRDCQGKKAETKAAAGLLCPITIGGPFEMIGMDLLGPFPLSEKGNKNIIVATDYLTRWAECKALPNGSTQEVAKFFAESIVCRYGAPKKVLTDRGKCFDSQFMETVYKLFASKHTRTTAYHPATNGLTERFNKTLATMLSMYVNSSHSDWDNCLPYVCFAYNTSLQSSTRFSPFFLLHGYEATLPSAVNDTITLGCDNAIEYAELVSTLLEVKRKIAQTNIEDSQTANKARYDSKHRPVIYEPGDRVLVYTPRRKVGRSEKLLHFFYGPYTVLKRCGLNSYQVKGDKISDRPDIVHVNSEPELEWDELPIQTTHGSDIIDRRSDIANHRSDIVNHRSDIANHRSDIVNHRSDVIDHRSDIANHGSDTVNSRSDNKRNLSPLTTHHSDSETSESEETVYYRFPSPQNTPPNSPEPELQPRRSQRQRRAPNKLTYLLSHSLFLLLICQITNIQTAFIKANPVIWRPATTPIISGDIEVDIGTKYYEPCAGLSQALIEHNMQPDFLNSWCRSAFEISFLKQISQMCKDVTTEADSKMQVRDKRFLVLESAMIIIGVVSVLSLGIGAVSLAVSSKTRTEVNSLKLDLEKQASIIQNLTTNQRLFEKMLDTIDQQVRVLQVEVAKQNKILARMRNTIPTTSFTIASMVSNLQTTLTQLRDINRAWAKNKLDPAIFDLLNLTLPCGGQCPVEAVYSMNCYHNPMAQKLRFVLKFRKIDTESKLMVADPFTLLDYNETTGELCKLHYTGPKYVIYRKGVKCTIPVNSYNSVETDTLVVVPDTSSCNLVESNNTLLNWQGHTCEIRHSIQENELLQIKPINDINIIYCPGLTMKAYDRDVKCPEYPFQLNSQEKFTIGKFHYETDKSAIKTNLRFIPEASEKINFQLMPDLHMFDADELLDSLKDKYNNLKGQLRPIDLNDWTPRPFGLTLNLLSMLLLFIIIFMCIYAIKIRKRMIISPREQPCPEEVPLESTSGWNKRDAVTTTNERPMKGDLNKFLVLSVLLTLPVPGLFLPLNESNIEIIQISYRNPCQEFSILEMRNNCHKLLNETFLRPLSSVCSLKPEFQILNQETFPSINNRRRRSTTDEIKLVAIQTKLIIIKEKVIRFLSAWDSGEISTAMLNEIGLKNITRDEIGLHLRLKPLFCDIDTQCQQLTIGFVKIENFAVYYTWLTSLSILIIICLIILTKCIWSDRKSESVKLRNITNRRERIPSFPPPPRLWFA
uniref:RNA-directed DNA polymerase n=1 Tax=Tetranychus urticae TaxID=32264 RepID=A0A158P4K2_TETUR